MINNYQFSIVIPTYNEKENLEKLIPALKSLFPSSKIYIVDDNSQDDTPKLLKNLSTEYKNIFLISRKGKLGRGSAVIYGLITALKDKDIEFYLEMDADFSHNPEEISLLLENKNKNTLVIGSRYIKGSKIINWPKLRKFLSSLANLYIRSILKIPLHDFTNGFRLYSRSGAEIIVKSNPKVKGYTTLSETAYILYLHNFDFKEVPTTFINRKVGKSKISIKEYLQSLTSIVKIKQNYPRAIIPLS